MSRLQGFDPPEGGLTVHLMPDYDFKRLARRLGQTDPTKWRWKPRANNNEPRKSATRLDMFVGFALERPRRLIGCSNETTALPKERPGFAAGA